LGSEHTLFPLTPRSLHSERRLFLHNVWKLHDSHAGRLRSGSAVCGGVHRELYRLLGITCQRLRLITTSGRTDRTCQPRVEQYLRVFVNERQDDGMSYFRWRSSSTIPYPLQHSTDTVPTRLRSAPAHGFEPTQSPSHLETVNEFTDRMHSALTEAKSALTKLRMTCLATTTDVGTCPEYTPGDKVYLDGSDIRPQDRPKASTPFSGPMS